MAELAEELQKQMNTADAQYQIRILKAQGFERDVLVLQYKNLLQEAEQFRQEFVTLQTQLEIAKKYPAKEVKKDEEHIVENIAVDPATVSVVDPRD